MPAAAYACTGNHSCILNMEHQYRTMPSECPQLDTTLVLRNVRSLPNCQNQQKRGPSGNSQLPTAKAQVSHPPGERDCSEGGSSVATTIQGVNSIPSSSLNNSRVADITQRVTSTQYASRRRSISTPTVAALQAVIAHQYPEKLQCITLYPVAHSALQSLPLVLAVFITCLPPSLIQKPARSLPIHSARGLPKTIRDIGSCNSNRMPCPHLDQWSLAVAPSINLGTQT